MNNNNINFYNLRKTFSLRRDDAPWWNRIHDPQSDFITKWNHFFLVNCLVALYLDPLYLFYPIIRNDCLTIDLNLGIVVTFFRTVTDAFFLLHIFIKFKTAFVAPTSRVFGRGELVKDPKAIASRYLKSEFAIDLAAALPLPQLVIWFVIPVLKYTTADNANHTLSLIVLIQYVPRITIIFPLNRRIIKTAGIVAKSPWSGSVYNLLMYILISHLLGAVWYLFSMQRQYECWSIQCRKESNVTRGQPCRTSFLDCDAKDKPQRRAWLSTTQVLSNCDAKNDDKFQFGIFADAFTNAVAESSFFQKYFYCLWWGLKTLSCYGQNLETSTYVGETVFSIVVCIGGLILFSHLIGKMQTYLQSTNARLEEWRVKRKDTEEWMRHRQLPEELQERVRRFVQYKWLATRGADEESILGSLPLDLRRQIQRHLCLAFVQRVPFFAQMDQQLLDAICERLYSSLNTRDTFIIREGDPVNEMLFIIRGQVESSTTNGGRAGFYNSIVLRVGDFCGEELLTWALMPNSTLNLPLSTRTVRSITEVEAFALRAEDLKFVAGQFKRLNSKKLQHAFRYYSHQWRTWGACFIQIAWRRYLKRKQAMELAMKEGLLEEEYYSDETPEQSTEDSLAAERQSPVDSSANAINAPLGGRALSSRLSRRLSIRLTDLDPDGSNLKMPKMFKPQDLDFSADQ
ncbi:probable cyclic nucleotide-gated ion channel 16 [Mangifera indica]|uniref:probable cyclic nucleotide-gated ion channel 16 n=1 Tax=Mangifera indica TaxID=29780 RepID=UPI001CF9FE42|nr:probable cyclic nucleotide-gated ion channel 16 [Mangifera indica]